MKTKKNEEIQAIILAAGMGSRLKPLTNDIPKSLVPVNGVPFLINALNALSVHNEVREALIVVGYKKNMIKELIGSNYKGLKITYIDNDEWKNTNNMYSFWLAGKHVNRDLILMESDVFFEHKLLDILFEQKQKSIALLSKYEPFMSGTVAEIKENGEIKELFLGSMQGSKFDFSNKYKTINVYSFSYDCFKNYFMPTMNIYIHKCLHDYYELVLGALIYLHVPIFGYVVNDIKWFEVDTVDDLGIATKLFHGCKELQ